MITKRIIPCLDVRDGRVVKGTKFKDLNDVSSPVELAKFYTDAGADELVFYDITASSDGRKLFTEILTETAANVFIPLTVGGGISTVADFDRVLKCGADKVSVNSGAIRNPSIIGEAAKLYGDQCVVISADIALIDFSAPHLRTCHNILNGLVFSAKGGDVAMTMVRGKILYQNGSFPTIDLKEVVRELTEYAIPRLFASEKE